MYLDFDFSENREQFGNSGNASDRFYDLRIPRYLKSLCAIQNHWKIILLCTIICLLANNIIFGEFGNIVRNSGNENSGNENSGNENSGNASDRFTRIPNFESYYPKSLKQHFTYLVLKIFSENRKWIFTFYVMLLASWSFRNSRKLSRIPESILEFRASNMLVGALFPI